MAFTRTLATMAGAAAIAVAGVTSAFAWRASTARIGSATSAGSLAADPAGGVTGGGPRPGGRLLGRHRTSARRRRRAAGDGRGARSSRPRPRGVFPGPSVTSHAAAPRPPRVRPRRARVNGPLPSRRGAPRPPEEARPTSRVSAPRVPRRLRRSPSGCRRGLRRRSGERACHVALRRAPGCCPRVPSPGSCRRAVRREAPPTVGDPTRCSMTVVGLASSAR